MRVHDPHPGRIIATRAASPGRRSAILASVPFGLPHGRRSAPPDHERERNNPRDRDDEESNLAGKGEEAHEVAGAEHYHEHAANDAADHSPDTDPRPPRPQARAGVSDPQQP